MFHPPFHNVVNVYSRGLEIIAVISSTKAIKLAENLNLRSAVEDYPGAPRSSESCFPTQTRLRKACSFSMRIGKKFLAYYNTV